MRRGLMAWDADEIPLDMLRGRVRRLQTAMAAAGQDAFVLYTNFIRSGAVSWLTAFSPYWADGVLLVPREGEPVFATTLSKRVGTWIQTVKPVGDLVNSPTPGAVLGKRLAAAGHMQRVAVLEADSLPSDLHDDLTAALPGVEIVDGSATFAAARAQLDSVERRLLEKSYAIARSALNALTLDAATDAGNAVGAVEEQARLQGAEEVYLAIAPDLDLGRTFLRLSGERALGRRFAIRATVAYKGSWVRCVQTYARDENDRLAIQQADDWFCRLIANGNSNGITQAISELPHAEITGWVEEAPVGTRPLSVIASGKNSAASGRAPAFILTLGMTVDGVPWCGAGLMFGRSAV